MPFFPWALINTKRYTTNGGFLNGLYFYTPFFLEVLVLCLACIFSAIKPNIQNLSMGFQLFLFYKWFLSLPFFTYTSLLPINTPIAEAIINPLVHPLESPKQCSPFIFVSNSGVIFTRFQFGRI